jgi:hypothetical protein
MQIDLSKFISIIKPFNMSIGGYVLFSDIEKLFNLAEKAKGWVQLVKTIKQQPDALVLASAGILVSALHTLDNSFHEIVGELSSFDADWSFERREQKIKQINQKSTEL